MTYDTRDQKWAFDITWHNDLLAGERGRYCTTRVRRCARMQSSELQAGSDDSDDDDDGGGGGGEGEGEGEGGEGGSAHDSGFDVGSVSLPPVPPCPDSLPAPCPHTFLRREGGLLE